jgi:hypothetical protein
MERELPVENRQGKTSGFPNPSVKGICGALGGNSDNDANCGFYCNLNNDVSNANWNVSAAQTY